MTLLMGTKQFKLYLDSETVEKLEKAATKHGRRSGQQVATEVLETYLSVWTAVSDAMTRAVSYQQRQTDFELPPPSGKRIKVGVTKEKAK